VSTASGSGYAAQETAVAGKPGEGRRERAPCSSVELGTQVVHCHSLKTADSPRLDGEDLDHVAVLAETRWPPIVVHRQTMRVIDGMHRLRAAQLRGDRRVEVEFFDGDADEAFVAAVQANVAHGLPLTLADRKAAAHRMLGWKSQRSDRSIAEATGLSPGTIATIRRAAGAADAPEVSRLGRDGRVRPLNPADGRLRAQQEIIAHPDASLREIAQAAGVSPATAKKVRDALQHSDDMVPGQPPISQPEKTSPTNGSETSTGRGERVPGDDHRLGWSLHRLKKDPSLRYSQSGRTLLRQLDLHARGPATIKSMIDVVPSHCSYVIADIARECARQWREVAESLEHRIRNAG
jgi:ParB-like chromosome segregation protein Spo0J